VKGVQWRWSQVTVAHDGLAEAVEAMLQMCCLPTWARKPFWQLLVLMVILADVAAVVQSLAELYADGVDAVQVVEHVGSVRKSLASTSRKHTAGLRFFWDWCVLEMILASFQQTMQFRFEGLGFFIRQGREFAYAYCHISG
jgi:hypothetical protein